MKKHYFAFVCSLLMIIGVQAQREKAPMHYFLEFAELEYEDILSVAPSFPDPEAAEGNKYTELFNQWAGKHPMEWESFRSLPKVAALNPNWQSYGVSSELIPSPDVFESSFWMWYEASGIENDKKNQLFPHFPEPELTGNTEKDLRNYNGRLGSWMRLYPKEYITFLNTEELMALVPSRTGPVQLNYMPKFLGAPITDAKPVYIDKGNPVMDDFEYQRAIRNWYFVFDKPGFDNLYGKDYDFPEDFDQEQYRDNLLVKIEAKKNGEIGEDDEKRKGKCKNTSTEPLPEGPEIK